MQRKYDVMIHKSFLHTNLKKVDISEIFLLVYTDPNLFVSTHGVRKMRIRDGKSALNDHEESTKGIVTQGMDFSCFYNTF